MLEQPRYLDRNHEVHNIPRITFFKPVTFTEWVEHETLTRFIFILFQSSARK